jgi:hypothetical protein
LGLKKVAEIGPKTDHLGIPKCFRSQNKEEKIMMIVVEFVRQTYVPQCYKKILMLCLMLCAIYMMHKAKHPIV